MSSATQQRPEWQDTWDSRTGHESVAFRFPRHNGAVSGIRQLEVLSGNSFPLIATFCGQATLAFVLQLGLATLCDRDLESRMSQVFWLTAMLCFGVRGVRQYWLPAITSIHYQRPYPMGLEEIWDLNFAGKRVGKHVASNRLALGRSDSEGSVVDPVRIRLILANNTMVVTSKDHRQDVKRNQLPDTTSWTLTDQ